MGRLVAQQVNQPVANSFIHPIPLFSLRSAPDIAKIKSNILGKQGCEWLGKISVISVIRNPSRRLYFVVKKGVIRFA
jgi:hypothetical protein